MEPFTVILDACVLYPAPLRDVLLELAGWGLFRARWTDAIHDEWMENLLEARPDLDRAKLQRTRDLMNRAVPDALVAGYEPLIEGLTLPDLDDRHVLAAAITARARAIITFNAKDFPEETLGKYGIEAQHPDDFLRYQFELAPDTVCQAIKKLRARLTRPPVGVSDYLDGLTRQRLPQFAQRLRKFENQM